MWFGNAAGLEITVLKDQEGFTSRKFAFFSSEPNPEKLLGKAESGNINKTKHREDRITGEGSLRRGKHLPCRQTSQSASPQVTITPALALTDAQSTLSPPQRSPSLLYNPATQSLQGTMARQSRGTVPPMGQGT